MTKTQSSKPKTPFPSAPLPWAWNYIPAGGLPTRERCLSVGTPKEKEQAVALVAEYPRNEELYRDHDISAMAEILAKPGHDRGFDGEMLRRKMGQADHSIFLAAEAKLAEKRQEAMDLVAPVIRRVLVSYSESLAQAALEAEARLEANGLPLRAGNQWVLHEDAVCRALLSCRVKVEKALFELQPLYAVGAVQFFLTNEEHTPFNWP
jgi:hypothetical protein